ncbi:phosphoglycerate mutase-like protein [Xylaria sp. CBS 124048]|nr:phosphoglycerate mutase-like protein [Xylaria sp. CBS 124048]
MGLGPLLLSLATLPLVKAETVLGVYVFSRHGDRTPKILAPANLTSLGADEVFASGSFFRDRYVASNAASPIFGLSHDVVALDQLSISAPVDNVLQNSAQAFAQGLYPPAGNAASQELRNTSFTDFPLGGYQYIPVNTPANSVSSSGSENAASLQSGSKCTNAVISSNNYFKSSEYQTTFAQSSNFFTSLLPVINSTFAPANATYKNAYTIFDYIHVATIHNLTIPSSDLLTNATLRELQVLANIHEWNLAFNSSDTIRAIAGATLAGQVVQALNNTIATRGQQPFNIQFGAYAAFSAFFGLAQLPADSADFTGIVDYASTMTFELVTNASVANSYPTADDISVRFLFTNQSAAIVPPAVYPLFGQTETLLPWSKFVSEMNKFAVTDMAEWCQLCGVSSGMCANVAAGGATQHASKAKAKSLTLTEAGVIGALVALAVVLGAEALVFMVSGLRVIKKSALARPGSPTISEIKA